MDAATIVAEVAATEEQAASAATSAMVAAEAATHALGAAEVLESRVEEAEQAAAAAVVSTVQETARETEWNTERLNRMQTELSETRAMVAPLMTTLETLTGSVALLANSSQSAGSPSSEPATPNPQSANADGRPDQGTPAVVPPEPEPQPSPARKEKRFRLMR